MHSSERGETSLGDNLLPFILLNGMYGTSDHQTLIKGHSCMVYRRADPRSHEV